MGQWRKSVLDIREMVRRFRSGDGTRRVAREMGLSRTTVAKYREWAEREGLLVAEELPEPGIIEEAILCPGVARHPGPVSLAEPYRDFISEKRKEGVECQALLGLLRERGYQASYSTLRRFVERLEPQSPEVFVRIETEPGEEAQVDFGFAGRIFDERSGRFRKAWVFVMTLSFSRHQYVEIVFDQKVETWLELHVRALEWFGGVVRRVVIDNLKAAIVRAVLHDAEAQRSFREFAEHYDFLIAPCRPGMARHKGKVESGVRYVKRNALAGRTFSSLREANEYLRRWALEVAGVRDHGTTHEEPLSRFEREKPHLKPLPAGRYEVTTWKQAKLHPDCHLVFDYAYYSSPYRLVGEELWVRATPRRVEIYRDYERVATHSRARVRGEWVTNLDHYPPEKVQGLLPAPVTVRDQARAVGPSTADLVEQLLGDRPLDRLRSAQGILKLAKRFGPKRLEAACRRALAFGEVRYHTIKTILKNGLDAVPLPGEEDHAPLPKTSLFARAIHELVPAQLQ